MFFAISDEIHQNVVHAFDNEADRTWWIQHQDTYRHPRSAAYEEALAICWANTMLRYGYADGDGIQNILIDAVYHVLDDGIDYMSTENGSVRWNRDIYWGDREVLDENARDYDV